MMTYRTIINRYITPKSTNEDNRRQEFILNLLLIGSIGLAVAAFLIVLSNILLSGDFSIIPRLYVIFGAFTFFTSLYILSRIQFHQIAALLFILTYFTLATYTLYTWGILIHIGLLLYALIIVISGVLLGTQFTFLATGLIITTLLALAYSTANQTIQPSLEWTKVPGGFDDAITFSIVFIIITVVTWLSNRETERSLARARRSEAALIEQRDSLELIVEERTRELRKTQQEEIVHLYQFAELGKLASTLIHDLINPLTSLSLSLERLENKEKSVLITRAINGAHLMENFLRMARKEIKNQKELHLFAAEKAIRFTIGALEQRAKKEKVSILFHPKAKVEIFGNSVKFQELISNLINNAIDAYKDYPLPKGERATVTIELLEENLTALVTVSDNGRGIPNDIIDKIYDPFFSTKENDEGLGLGLSIVKDIVDKEFGGSINVSSQPAVGTSFLVRLPMKQQGL
jgi:signal transduction histidine kinase